MSTSFRDTLIRERYLLHFDWAMQDYPKPKRIVRELRTELTATASEVGMRQAVADLGHPRVLADAYLSELGRRVPRWTTGAVWGALAIAVVMYLTVAYAIGTLDTIDQMGGGTVERVFLGRPRPSPATTTSSRSPRRSPGRGCCSTRACSWSRSCWAPAPGGVWAAPTRARAAHA